MSGLREIRLHCRDGTTVEAAALGNNAAWICPCDRDTPLLGSLGRRQWIEMKCPSCGRRYSVTRAPRGLAGDVKELPPA
jgi:hypothetical protein